MRVFECLEFGLENCRVVERPEPRLAAGQVRVNVKAFSLNYRDLMMVKGLYNPKIPRPFVVGSDAAGVVEDIADDVSEFAVGDRVITHMCPGWEQGAPPADVHARTLGGPGPGVFSQVLTIAADALIKVPHELSMTTAACLPVAGLTAWNALRAIPPWRSDPVVLVLGTGGVSCLAAQLAIEKGYNVAVTSSSEHKLQVLHGHGVRTSVNYREHPKWSTKIRESFPEGVDLVVEVGGSGTFNQSVKATRIGGCIALIGVLAGRGDPPDLTRVLMHDIRVQGLLVGSRERGRELVDFVHSHNLKPIFGQGFHGIEALPDAFKLLQQADHIGKIVVNL